jgi:drug/metabolite transporter (DMT)-like permease
MANVDFPAPPFAASKLAPKSSNANPFRKGLGFGLGAVAMWGSYLALAKLGVSKGLAPIDFAFIRYTTAGLIMLPWLLTHDPAGLAGVGEYAFAPLAHGAVVQPATIVIATTLLAAFVFGDRPDRARIIGISVIIGGLAAIAGPSLLSGSTLTLVGDILCVAAGLLWAGFTVLTRRWGMKAPPATASVSVISMAVVIPVFIATQDFSRISSLSFGALVTQIPVQGVCSGVVAVILFARATELLELRPI